ncbi:MULTISPECIES: hypothetical protein [Oceanobacillus]|uniref:Uncharacterized protein n=1 Tax=Oceanobacillus indicireducens TaxID=1004261 RepID=A0A917Y0F1_9BACI|nr:MULTISPECIES: hypothetical protein [Oceanobacillus]GGN61497.1 hypothetical protein GCM10007971_26570 [Oceanobacillus indicireducens]
MNISVLILFLNATLLPVLSLIIVVTILRKQYLPVIRQMEKEEAEQLQEEGKVNDAYKMEKNANVN